MNSRKKISSGYNLLSFIYDFLIFLFGNVVTDSQTDLIRDLPADLPDNLKVLIIGEGTGNFLKKLLQEIPGSKVTCLDISSRMIETATDKLKGKSSSVEMICTDAFEYSTKEKYDLIVTNFFFDQYNRDSFFKIVNRYSPLLSPAGYWYFTDFVPKKGLWGKTVMFLLYAFFGIICRVEARKLEDFPAMFQEYGFEALKNQSFFFNIESILYHKTSQRDF